MTPVIFVSSHFVYLLTCMSGNFIMDAVIIQKTRKGFMCKFV